VQPVSNQEVPTFNCYSQYSQLCQQWVCICMCAALTPVYDSFLYPEPVVTWHWRLSSQLATTQKQHWMKSTC